MLVALLLWSWCRYKPKECFAANGASDATDDLQQLVLPLILMLDGPFPARDGDWCGKTATLAGGVIVLGGNFVTTSWDYGAVRAGVLLPGGCGDVPKAECAPTFDPAISGCVAHYGGGCDGVVAAAAANWSCNDLRLALLLMFGGVTVLFFLVETAFLMILLLVAAKLMPVAVLLLMLLRMRSEMIVRYLWCN